MQVREFQCNVSGPTIEPPTVKDSRPTWSVMIPTFNCARMLRETLQSVLAQDPGPERMQIEVVDDCSTRDKPEDVVQELAPGRVSFHRHAANVGVSGNFNACIRRAKGTFVHILHGDDLVLPGFYQCIESLAEAYPEAAMLATRTIEIDEQGSWIGLSEAPDSLRSLSHSFEHFLYQNPFRTPSIVLRRRFYEQHGGFLESLNHVADWEMWVRAIAVGGGVMCSEPLAKYRLFPANDTSRVMRTGDNLREYLRLATIFSDQYPGFDAPRFQGMVTSLAYRQAKRYAGQGDWTAFEANNQLVWELAPQTKRWIYWMKSLALRRFGRRACPA